MTAKTLRLSFSWEIRDNKPGEEGPETDSNRKKRAAEWFYQTLYRDEQIVPRAPRAEDVTPAEIREMRKLEYGPEVWRLPREAIFVRQARLMEKYEDDYVYTRDVVRYFPTYASLTDRELRGYFSWRIAWRRGEREKTQLSYAFLYIYELLNQIGVSDPMDGYEKLRRFLQEYGSLDDGIESYLKTWLWDYVVYYRLDPILLAGREETEQDRQMLILRELDTRSEDEILEAVLALSSYRLDRSKLYLTEPQLTAAAITRVLRGVSLYYEKHRKQSLWEDCFGALAVSPYVMFSSAVFYDKPGRPDCDYEATPLCSYACRGGRWTVKRRNGPNGRSKRLGDIVRTVDAMLREALGLGNAIQPGLSTKWIVKEIEEQLASLLREKREAEARKVTIDYAKLSGIRSDASTTQRRLIAAEEAWEETETPQAAPEAEVQKEPVPAPQEAAPPEDGLDEQERRFLHALLYGESLDWLGREGVMPSVLVDRINEILFDRFDDTVLLLEGEPELIEDYIDELKEMIPA